MCSRHMQLALAIAYSLNSQERYSHELSQLAAYTLSEALNEVGY